MLKKNFVKRDRVCDKETPVFSIIASGLPEVRLCMVLSMVEQEWSNIVGEALARRSTPRAFENGILLVSADSQSALSDLNFKSSLIKKVIERKTLLKLNGVRVEINRSVKRRVKTSGVTKKTRDRSAFIDPVTQDELKSEILNKYSGIDPDLAGCIARCRIMSVVKS